MRPIDADALKKSVPNTHVDIFENCRNCELLDDEQVEELIDNAPTIDAVPVVRCKECKFAHMTYGGECKYCDVWESEDSLYLDGDFFCAFGERKE